MRRRLWTEEAGRPERRELQKSRRNRMSEVISFTVASVERYFQTELIWRSWQQQDLVDSWTHWMSHPLHYFIYKHLIFVQGSLVAWNIASKPPNNYNISIQYNWGWPFTERQLHSIHTPQRKIIYIMHLLCNTVNCMFISWLKVKKPQFNSFKDFCVLRHRT